MNHIYFVGSLFCVDQSTLLGTWYYEHRARFFCSKRTNERLGTEHSGQVYSSAKLSFILSVCRYILQLLQTFLRTELYQEAEGLTVIRVEPCFIFLSKSTHMSEQCP